MSAKSVKEQENLKILETPSGNIEYRDEDVYIFPQGMIGYEIWKKYILLPVPGLPEDSPYTVLQSLDNKDLSFILMQIIVEEKNEYEEEPIIYFNHLKEYLEESQMQLSKTGVMLVISIESQPDGKQEISANLAGPILMDPHKRIGRQVVLEEERYDCKKVISCEKIKESKTK